MRIASVELFHVDVPFEHHTGEHMRYWLPHWRISQVCKLTLEDGIVGWGETLPNYTWGRVPDDVAERIIGHEAAELLWQADLGAGVEMALFDAVGQALGVPAYRLLGKPVREWCPISWWAIDMPPEDWAQQCAAAVRQGYTSAKLKARPWFDLHEALQAIGAATPEQFTLDLDFNGTLGNAANAVRFLKSLERYSQVAVIESPIPQEDIEGNAQIRRQVGLPVAIHYGIPPVVTALKRDVMDGFVVGNSAPALLRSAHVCEEAHKPFWLQLVGTGLTTAWAAHWGAVLPQAVWPAITCMNIYESQLLAEPIVVRGGFYRVPEKPGLGTRVDEEALQRYRVDYDTIAPPRHVYRYVRANGIATYYGCGKQALGDAYVRDAQPTSEAGATLETILDDASAEFEALWAATQDGRTVRE